MVTASLPLQIGIARVFRRDSPPTRSRRSEGSGGESPSMLTSVEGNEVQAFFVLNAFITELETSARSESKRMTNHNTPQLSRMDPANHCAAFPGLSRLNTRAVNASNSHIPFTLWPESASELYRPSDRRFSAKLVPTFVDKGLPRGHLDGCMWPYSWLSRPEPLPFLPSSSSVVLIRLSAPRFRLTATQKIL
jgi:hypothetical protein